MSIPLLIWDVFLLLLFLISWLESTATKNYRFTWWRFLRAISVPLGFSLTLHCIAASNWWGSLNWSSLIVRYHPFFEPGLWAAICIVSIMFAPPLVIWVVVFVANQFSPDSPTPQPTEAEQPPAEEETLL